GGGTRSHHGELEKGSAVGSTARAIAIKDDAVGEGVGRVVQGASEDEEGAAVGRAGAAIVAAAAAPGGIGGEGVVGQVEDAAVAKNGAPQPGPAAATAHKVGGAGLV